MAASRASALASAATGMPSPNAQLRPECHVRRGKTATLDEPDCRTERQFVIAVQVTVGYGAEVTYCPFVAPAG
jgi:hypothetical protein